MTIAKGVAAAAPFLFTNKSKKYDIIYKKISIILPPTPKKTYL